MFNIFRRMMIAFFNAASTSTLALQLQSRMGSRQFTETLSSSPMTGESLKKTNVLRSNYFQKPPSEGPHSRLCCQLDQRVRQVGENYKEMISNLHLQILSFMLAFDHNTALDIQKFYFTNLELSVTFSYCLFSPIILYVVTIY